MSVWTTKELAGKAKRPKVWKKLEREGVCEKHRPSDAAIESLPSVFAVFDAFREQLTERAKQIFSEIQRVIAVTYIEDFNNLTEALKADWTGRLELVASVHRPNL